MCQICRKYRCPTSCPSYCGDSAERGRAIAECTLCSEYICEDDEIEYWCGNPYCKECFDKLAEDL